MSEQLPKEGALTQLKQGLHFCVVELVFLGMFILGMITGDHIIAASILWASFIVSAVWVLITSSRASLADAKLYVLDGCLLVSDFLISSILLLVGAALVWSYDWWFPTMLLLAAFQNVRYTALASNWLKVAEDEKRSKRQGTDDSMS